MTRREFIALAAASVAPAVPLVPSHSIAKKTKSRFTSAAEEFMKSYNVPGLSVAFAYNGKMRRSGAYGYADTRRKTRLKVSHAFRIASVSKPITAVGIFKLIEQKKIKLTDRIFGEEGLLGIDGPKGITVHHLLNHTCGGWQNDASDPMFKKNQLNHENLINWTLKKYKLQNQPGEKYVYSNFGYCLLGRVIEKTTNQSYANFIRSQVLAPCGISGMFIGNKRIRQNEVTYFDDKGRAVQFPMNIARMDSHGGWVGTPREMVKFGIHVDGYSSPKDLLTQSSIKTMTQGVAPHKGYAYGWNVNKAGNYWHTGSLPGLTSLLVVTRSGFCWAACANTRTKGIKLALDRLMWKLSKYI